MFNNLFKPLRAELLRECVAERVLNWNGLTLQQEVAPGELRFGTPMQVGYGHIVGHIGEDREELDCYIGAHLESPYIYRILQLNSNKCFDEWKFCIGFNSKEQAEQAYIDHVPIALYGGIFTSSLAEIHKYAVIQVVDRQGYAMVESITSEQVAKKVISRICPPNGEKKSGNQRIYNDIPVLEAAEKIIAHQQAGMPIVNRYRHSDSTINRNDPVSLWTETYINDDGSIFILDEFLLKLPRGYDYAARCFRKEYVPRSWEVSGSCSQPGGHGYCDITDLDQVVWLDPQEGDRPGFGETACVIKIVEQLETAKTCKCQQASNPPTNPLITNANHIKIGEKSAMRFEKYLKKMFDAGASWAEIQADLAGEMFKATPEEIQQAIDWWLKSTDQMRSGNGTNTNPNPDLPAMDDLAMERALEMADDGSPKDPKKYAEAVMKNPVKAEQIINKNRQQLREKLEQQRVAQEKREKEFQQLQEAVNKPRLTPELEELDRDLKAGKEVDQTVSTLMESVSKRETIGSHTLGDEKRYPIAMLTESVSKVSEKVKKRKLDLNSAKLLLEEALDQALVEAAKTPNNTSTETIQGSYQISTNESNAIASFLEETYKAGDRHLLLKPGGQERLKNRDALAKHNKKFAEQAVKNAIELIPGSLTEAMKFFNDKKAGRAGNWQSVAANLLREKVVDMKEELTPLDAAVLGAQAFINVNAIRRLYEETPWLELSGSIGAAFFTPYKEDDPRFGLEFRFPLHDFLEPNVFLPRIKKPGESGFPGASMKRNFDSVYAEQYGVEYEYEEGQIHALRYEPNNANIIGEIEAELGGYWTRVVSRLCGDEFDNQARRYLSDKIVDEAPVAANLVVGNTIMVNGKKLVYDPAVTHIIRLRAGADQAGLTGADVQGRIIVRATPKRILQPNGKTSDDVRHEWSVKLPNGDDAVIGRLLQDGKRIVPDFDGDEPHGAFDENHGLFLCLGSANVTAGNVGNMLFSYSVNTRNVTRISLTPQGNQTVAQAYGNLVRTANQKAAAIQQRNKVAPRVAASSVEIGRGVIQSADEWQNYYNRPGSQLNAQYAEINEVGKLGLLTFWCTNGHFPLGNAGLLLLSPYMTQFAFAEKIVAGALDSVTVGQGVGKKNRRTGAKSQTFRARMAVHSPRLLDDNGEPINEPSHIIAFDDIQEGSGIQA